MTQSDIAAKTQDKESVYNLLSNLVKSHSATHLNIHGSQLQQVRP